MNNPQSDLDDECPKNGRRARLRQNVLAFVMLAVFLVLLTTLMRASATQAQAENSYSRFIRTIETEELGFSATAGLAFSPLADSFLTVNQTNSSQADSASSDLALITHRAVAAGVITVPAITHAINMAFDSWANRLLVFDDAAQELVVVNATGTGSVDGTAITRYQVGQYGLKNPQGMAVDPANGHLFILDMDAFRIVQVVPDASGNLAGEAALREGRLTTINLRNTGIETGQGLAFNPNNGHLYVWSPDSQAVHELTENGRVAATRDLFELRLTDVTGMVFAPSGDLTDEPSILNLYLMSKSQISEVTFIAPLVLEQAQSLVPVTLVRMTQTSQWSPPSPDPAGITYWSSTNTLFVSDSEVEEMTIWQGKNLFQATTTGTLTNGFNLTSFTKEPTDIAYNASNGHLFFSDDDKKKVFELNPGADGTIGTADDSLTSFSTSAYGNDDPEGVAFNNGQQLLYISDGVNREIYRVSPGANGLFDGVPPTGDDQVTHFDTAGFNQNDPEGVEYNPDRNTIYIVSRNGKQVAETTASGALLNLLDIAPLNAVGPAGLAYAPGSVNSSVKNLYIVARGVDNNADPNENDGKMYEVTGLPSDGQPAPTSTGTPPTPTSTATATPVGSTLTFVPVADARVDEANPATNYGTSATIKVDLSTDLDSYLRFNVSGVPGSIQNARLRLFPTSNTSNGPTIQATNNSWGETTINWNNRPAATSGVVDNLGVINTGVWVEFNVTSLVSGNGTFSFLLRAESTNGIPFSSREGNNPPQLVLTLGTTPTPGPSPTPTQTPAATATTPPSLLPLALSLASNGAVGNLASVADEDIVSFDGTTWSMLFDGSDVGAGSMDVDAFYRVDADTILLSFDKDGTVAGLAVDDSDIIQFDATALGTNTVGTFTIYFDGSDVGLDVSSEDVDGLELLADGRILLSTVGSLTVPGSSGADEDIFAFTPTSLGANTSGTWAMYFDGSDVGLNTNSGEDVNGLAVAGNGNIYLTTLDIFAVTGISGENEDIFICTPTSLGANTACTFSPTLYFDGSIWGLSANNIDAIDLP